VKCTRCSPITAGAHTKARDKLSTFEGASGKQMERLRTQVYNACYSCPRTWGPEVTKGVLARTPVVHPSKSTRATIAQTRSLHLLQAECLARDTRTLHMLYSCSHLLDGLCQKCRRYKMASLLPARYLASRSQQNHSPITTSTDRMGDIVMCHSMAESVSMRYSCCTQCS
jgi:hypothetical protein